MRPIVPALALCLLAACPPPQPSVVTMPTGPGDPSAPPPLGADGTAGGVAVAPAALSPALQPLAWWLGWWNADRLTTSEYWVAAGGTIFGISLATDKSFEVMIVDDAPGAGPADGVLRFYAMPAGKAPVEFRGTAVGEQSATFANPRHDAPQTITYRRDAEKLVADLSGGMDDASFPFRPAGEQPATDIADADRAWAAAVAAHGIDAWVENFADSGGMVVGGKRVEHDEIADAMKDTLSSGRLAWAPVASGRRGDIGWTVGIGTFTGATPADNWRSAYATVWVRATSGKWRVKFDTGRIINE